MIKNILKKITDMSLGKKIPISIFILVMIVLGTSFYIVIERQHVIDNTVQTNNVKQVSNILLESIKFSMAEGEMDAVTEILYSTSQEESINEICLLDTNLDVYTSSNSAIVGDNKNTSAMHKSKSTSLPVIDTENYNQGSMTYVHPIIMEEDCLDCHDGEAGDLKGFLTTTISTNDVLMRHSKNRLYLSLLAWFLVFLVSGILFFIIRNMVVKPLSLVVDSLKDIAEGEGDLTKRLEIISKDELGELASWFNVFVEKLHGVIHKVKDSMEQVGNASDQISTASEELATGAEEQQSQLSEVASSMEEISTMILESSTNTSQTQENANSANEAANRGHKSVTDAVEGIKEVANIVNTAAEQIAALETRSKEIGDVIQVIDDIADQTNLLALNANIEAARAGDAGRGFAVVADEVRKLAERTVNATAEIGEKIKQIQSAVGSSVTTMKKTTEHTIRNQELATQSGDALDAIVVSIANVNQAIAQIANATDEQSSGAEEISKNIEGVSTVAREAASSSQELASSAEQLNREVQGLNELIGQFKV